MKNILLVQPNYRHTKETGIWMANPPLGLCYIAAVLRENGIKVEILGRKCLEPFCKRRCEACSRLRCSGHKRNDAGAQFYQRPGEEPSQEDAEDSRGSVAQFTIATLYPGTRFHELLKQNSRFLTTEWENVYHSSGKMIYSYPETAPPKSWNKCTERPFASSISGQAT